MKHALNRQGIGLIIGLAVQYALGMTINLFVEFPAGGSAHEMWDFTLHNPLVLVHLIIGTLLILGAATLVVRTIRQHVETWRLPAISGLVWVLTAWTAGDTFVTSQADILSYIMSLAFLLAVLSYVFGLYRSRGATSNK